MSQTVITSAFEQLKAQEAANGGVVILDEFVFANIPNLDITSPIDRGEGLPEEAMIVHRQAVGKTGMGNNNAVVYSVVMGADVGDFEFNWVGLVNKANNIVAMIVHAPTQKKIKTATGQQGNVLTRSFLMEYNCASEQTQIITPADTWQIDFTARLNGVDERIRCENMDIYGEASFIGDGFLVSKTGSQYVVKKGVGYVAGVRAELLFDQNITVSQKPVKVWADVAWKGTLTSIWASAVKLTVAETLENYTDNDEQHYVYALAEVLSDGSIHDLRTVNQIKTFAEIEAKERHLLWLDERKKLSQTAISEYMRDLLECKAATGILQNLELSSSGGGKLIGVGEATVTDVIKKNILSYMTKADQLAIKGSVGTEVVLDYALQDAVNDGVTILECPPVPGVYVFGKSVVTLPAGFSFEGGSRRTYTTSSDASFNNAGTVFRLFNGASSIFKLTSRHTFRRIILDGRDKSVRFMQGDDQTQWCRFFDCGIHRWSIGIGSSSPNGYSATVFVSGGTISNNTIGVKNVIDSLFMGVTINANDTNGVQLMTGANNNTFIGVRNEWNNGDNYYGYGCKRILIQGELIDRAGKRAVAAVGGAQFVLSGVAVQRSGRLAAEGSVDDSHFYLEGDTSSIIITPSYTTAGMNDDGSGRLSPTYILATGGNAADAKSFIASSSNLAGYTGASWLRSGTIATLSVQGCLGVEDVKNFGFHRISDGTHYLGDAVSGLPLSGAGNTATLTFTTTTQPLSRYSSDLIVRTLEFKARNNTSTGSVARYSVDVIISREQASASVAVDASSVKTTASLSGGTWGIASANPSGVSLAFAVSEDGTTLTATLTAVDSASRIISARLRA
ncbi:phage tail protein [Klebsiella pneumoniae]